MGKTMLQQMRDKMKSSNETSEITCSLGFFMDRKKAERMMLDLLRAAGHPPEKGMARISITATREGEWEVFLRFDDRNEDEVAWARTVDMLIGEEEKR